METTNFETKLDEFLLNIYSETASIAKIKLDAEKETEHKSKNISDEEWERLQAEEEKKFEQIWNLDFNLDIAETRGRKSKKFSIDGIIYENKEDAAKSLNVSVSTIKRMLKDGRANYISK